MNLSFGTSIKHSPYSGTDDLFALNMDFFLLFEQQYYQGSLNKKLDEF
jgi:hypothetical protein